MFDSIIYSRVEVQNFILFLSFSFFFLFARRDSGIEVRDFGASWRDGVAFLALIDAIKANLFNLVEMRKASTTNRQRLETAFDVAENKLGIARLLDAEDVDVEKPDEKSIMTYVAQFLHKYPEPKVSFSTHSKCVIHKQRFFISNSHLSVAPSLMTF